MPKDTIEFAVIDTETTGLFPEKYDRIIEIAVVKLGPDGQVSDEYCTLVNPNRDIGRTDIHGITAGDLSAAPRFEDVAGDVLCRLKNTVIVGHNVWFDIRFVKAELQRISAALPEEVPHLCTMGISSFLSGNLSSRKLAACCDHFGIGLEAAHSAIDDARASASILRLAIEELESKELMELIRPSKGAIEQYGTIGWPKLMAKGISHNRQRAKEHREGTGSYISRLVASLPPLGNTNPPTEPYADLLDRVLEDRRIDQHEFELLQKAATELQLSQERVKEVHERYLRDLIVVALKDGVISDREERDLDQVRVLLSISAERCRLLKEEVERDCEVSDAQSMREVQSELFGKSVCFTGELTATIDGCRVTRDHAESLAKSAGMIICKGVTKKLEILVVADPDSMSGKATKARQYGTRILAEAVFWKMLGKVVG